MLRKFLWGCAIVSALLCIVLSLDYFRFVREQEDLLVQKGSRITDNLKNQLEYLVGNIQDKAKFLADTIAKSDTLSSAQLLPLLKQESLKIEEILGITVAFEPDVFDSKERYAPYFDKDKESYMQIEKFYDYTDNALPTAQWYTKVRDSGAQWIEPYFAKAANTLVADYGYPIYKEQDNGPRILLGTVTITLSLESFQENIRSLVLGEAEFGFVSSESGKILAHPIPEYLGVQTVAGLLNNAHQPGIQAAYQAILEHKSGHQAYVDMDEGQKKLFYYRPITGSGWHIGLEFYRDILFEEGLTGKRKRIHLILTLSVLAFFIIAVFFNRDYLSVRELWYLSLLASVVLILDLVTIGYLHYKTSVLEFSTQQPPITDYTSLATFVNEQRTRKSKADSIVPQVNIGMFIERIEFEDSYDVNISGSLWQKYNPDKIPEFEPGFALPQLAPFAESSSIELRSLDTLKNEVIARYDFRNTLRINFDYSDYPFDKRNISVYIQPLDLTQNILFVPDLKSYEYTAIARKPGLNKTIEVSGNTILGSYYSYVLRQYNTDFGLQKQGHLRDVPILTFTIQIRRVLVTSFVTYLIPITVTLLMLFILLSSTRKNDMEGDINGLIQGMAAFFFVLIFSHIDLRKDIHTAELIYMEYYYFIAYGMIIATTYNLVVYTKESHALFDYKNNLIAQIIFWPLFLLIALSVTLLKFY